MNETKNHTAVLAGFDCEVRFLDTTLKEVKITEDGLVTVTVPSDWTMAKVEEAMTRHSEAIMENLEKAVKGKPPALAGIIEYTYIVPID